MRITITILFIIIIIIIIIGDKKKQECAKFVQLPNYNFDKARKACQPIGCWPKHRLRVKYLCNNVYFYHLINFIINTVLAIMAFIIVSSVRSSNSHPDLILIHHHHPTFSDHTGPQHWTFTF